MKKILLTLILFILISFVSAEGYSTGVQALGFQADQPYFGAGSGASVNAYSGNVVMTATDASILGANGLGAGFTRVYNSNVYANTPLDGTSPKWNNLRKPGWLGHGWGGSMGKIVIPYWEEENEIFTDCVNGECFVKETQFYLENGDGSRQIMLSNVLLNNYYGYNEHYSDVLWEEWDSNYPENNLKRYVFSLPDFSKVIWYHNLHPTKDYCHRNAGDAFVRIMPDGTRMYYTHWVEYDGAYSDIEDGRYCESSADCEEGFYCEDLNDECLLIGHDKSYGQLNYPGVYLSHVVDPNENMVEVQYYDKYVPEGVNPGQTIYDECPLEGSPTELVEDGRSWGSPFIKKIITKTKNGAVVGELNFEVDNSYSINGRLDYITFKNHLNEDIKVDYVYSGDPGESNPYQGKCYDYNGVVCDDGALLIRVDLKKGNDLIFPSVEYEYYIDYGDPASFFAVHKVTSGLGAETEYKYSYDPDSLCPGASGYAHKVKRLIQYFTRYEDSDGTLRELEYNYDYSTSSPDSCLYNDNNVLSTRTTTLEGPRNDEGEYTKTTTKYFSLADSDLAYSDFASGKVIETETHECQEVGVVTIDPPNHMCSGIGGRSLSLKCEVTAADNYCKARGYEGYLDGTMVCDGLQHEYGNWANGASGSCGFSNPLYDCCGSAGSDEWIETMDCSVLMSCELRQRSRTGYSRLGFANVEYLNCPFSECGFFDATYTSYPYMGVTTIYDEYSSERSTAQKKLDVDGYGNVKKAIDYGEIHSFTTDNHGLISFDITVDNVDDSIVSKVNYYHEYDNSFEGYGDLFKYFIRLPKETVVETDAGVILSKSEAVSYDDKGRLLQSKNYEIIDGQIINPAGFKTDYEYDGFGNVRKITNEKGQDYFMSYIGGGAALKREIVYLDDDNIYGDYLMKTYTYSTGESPGTYKLIRQDDENGNIYRYKYDSLGRLRKVIGPGDEENNPALEVQYCDPGIDGCPEGEISATVKSKKDGTEYYNEITNFYDSLGRHKRTKQLDLDGENYIVVDTFYNEEGLVDKKSKPYHVEAEGVMGRARNLFEDWGLVDKEFEKVGRSSEIEYTEYIDYDALNRLREVKAAGAIDTVRTEYGVDWNRVYDENDKFVTSYSDARGRTVKVVDPDGEDTNFEYDKLGNLLKTIDAKGHQSTGVYNSLGQVLSSTHPDAGQVNYVYDEIGNLDSVSYGDYNLVYEYDGINRPIKVKVNGVVVKEYRYDYCQYGKGKLCSVTEGPISIAYEYNEKGNIVETYQTINDEVFLVEYEHYDGGNVKKITYPKRGFLPGKEIIYEYDNLGRLDNVGLDANHDGNIDQDEVIENIEAYNVEGTISRLRYGNDVVTEYNYNDRDWLNGIKTYKELEEVFTRSYVYDKVGNLANEFSDYDGQEEIASYEYDGVYRLKKVIDKGIYNGLGNIVYVYDEVGNRLSKTVGLQGDNYLYGNNNNQITETDLFRYLYSSTGNMEEKVAKDVVIGFDRGEPYLPRNYAFYDVEANVGDQVRVSYKNDDYVWYSFVEEGKVVFINQYNFDAEESQISSAPTDTWFTIQYPDEDFEIKPAGLDYEYDYANRLIKVIFPGGECEGYVYDANGRRVQKMSSEEETSTYYIYDLGLNPVYVKTQSYIGDCSASGRQDVCGNKVIDAGEVCDEYVFSDGWFTSECNDFLYPEEYDCSGNYLSGIISCSETCDEIDNGDCNDPTNGYLEDGEICVRGAVMTCEEANCGGGHLVYAICGECSSSWDNSFSEDNCDCTQTSTCLNAEGDCINTKISAWRPENPEEFGCDCIQGECFIGCDAEDLYRCDEGWYGTTYLEEGIYKMNGRCAGASCCLKFYKKGTKGIYTEILHPGGGGIENPFI